MVAAGAFECRGYVTLAEADLDRWSVPSHGGFAHQVESASLVRLRNAVQADQDILRPSIVPNLVKSLAENLKHERSVRLFEVGHVFLAAGPDTLPSEPVTLGIAYAGRRERFDRFHPERDGGDELDFFDLKGALEAVLGAMGARHTLWDRSDHPALHPGRAASLSLGGTRIGTVGEVRPDLARTLGVEDVRLSIAELDLDSVLTLTGGIGTPIPVDRFLPVEQDFAIVVDSTIAAAEVEAALKRGAGPLLSGLVLFDVFAGEQLGQGKKSLAYRLTFTAPDRALTDAELTKVRKRIERTITQDLGATLRA